MKKATVILLFATAIFSCKSPAPKHPLVWTPAYEQKWYNQIDKDVKPRLPNDIKRKEFVLYIIKRMKAELPGGVESVPIDSINRLSAKIGTEYAYSHKGQANTDIIPSLRPWTKDMELALRKVFLTDVPNENYKQQEKLCDCVVSELKTIYPDSVMIRFPKDVIQKTAKDCFDKINKP